MRLVLGKDFPAVPPRGYFLTKIFHPNVSHKGEICVNVLKRDWKAELGLRHVLLVSIIDVHVFHLDDAQLFGSSVSTKIQKPLSVTIFNIK